MRALFFRPRVGAVLAGMVLAGMFAATALAAHPKTGRRYSGFTSEPKIVGFAPPISFMVSSTATKLLGVRYGTIGCFGGGGFRPGVDPWTGNAIVKVGSIALARNGHFSATGAKSSIKITGAVSGAVVTTTTIVGRFTSARRATGTVSFTQTENFRHEKPVTCGPSSWTFEVTLG
jgi:hypothetical protein